MQQCGGERVPPGSTVKCCRKTGGSSSSSEVRELVAALRQDSHGNSGLAALRLGLSLIEDL